MPTLSPKVTPYYGGGQVPNPANVIQTSGAPSSKSEQDLGTIAVDNALGNIYMLASKIGGSTWDLIGSERSSYSITPFVVGPEGQAGYQTIQSAITAANAAGGGVIWVQPGTYTENLTLFSNVDIIGTAPSGETETAVTIIGTHTPPASGSFSASDILFQSATNVFSSTAAGTAVLSMFSCRFNVTNGYVFHLANWTGSINVGVCGTSGTNDGFIDNSSGSSAVFIYAASIGIGTSNAMLINGSLITSSSYINCPATLSGSSTFFIDAGTTINQPITLTGTSSGTIRSSSLVTGSSSSITQSSTGTILITNCSIETSAANALAGTGAGAITLNGVDFTNSSGVAGTLTLAVAGSTTTRRLNIVRGTNAAAGSGTLSSGVLAVTTTACTTSSLIFPSYITPEASPGTLSAVATANTVTITSTDDTDSTSTVQWFLVN